MFATSCVSPTISLPEVADTSYIWQAVRVRGLTAFISSAAARWQSLNSSSLCCVIYRSAGSQMYARFCNVYRKGDPFRSL